MRPVTVGREIGRFTVIAKGVNVGERVVVDGQSRLTTGTKVDAKDETAPAHDGAAASTDALVGTTVANGMEYRLAVYIMMAFFFNFDFQQALSFFPPTRDHKMSLTL